MINIQVDKLATENNTTLIRRFTKKVQASGIIQRVKKIRYSARHISSYTKKKKALKSLRNRANIADLIKLGKIVENKRR